MVFRAVLAEGSCGEMREWVAVQDTAAGGESIWARHADGVWLPDAAVLLSAPDGTVVRASEQAAELAGEASPEALVGRRLTELLVPDGAVWRLRSRGPGVSLVRTVTWPHGEDERLRVTVLLDVTDLTAALNRLSADQRVRLIEVERTAGLGDPSLRDAQRMARIGTWEWDPATDVIRPSSAMGELTGWPHSVRVSFEDYLAAVHPDDRAWVREAWAPLVRHHHPVEVEHRYVRPDGTARLFRVRGTATRDADGEVVLVGTTQDITEQSEAAPALRYRSTHDVVTGLPNRAAVHELLQQVLRPGGGLDVAVLACRIDNFKRVITSLGHDAGDELLVLLSRRLTDGLGEECTVARVSGEDEFLIICSDLAAVGGLEALTSRVSGLVQTPVPVRDQFLRVSTSIGAAVHNPGQGVDDLLRFATAAMGQARQHGLGQVRRAGPTLMDSVDQQVHVEGQLRAALHQDGLQLHYQPVVAADGAILAAEALVRWPHPDRGMLSPGAFLPVAERGGLLRELDHWVLRTALRDAARWRAPQGHPQVSISVNLTGLVPADPGFGDLIAEAMAETGLDWHRLILELVETELADPRTQTRRGMLGLTRRGARFAIDDFGTGHSSLARLKHLPAQLIKIDRQFVSGIDAAPEDRAMTRAMIDMTHALGRHCIAEGVETAGEFNVLSELGADAYQGWLFARAMPEHEFATLLARAPLYVPPGSTPEATRTTPRPDKAWPEEEH
jgi:diguanylate cyclase (GGDEF)-like protein/PAS domain S-box-containing protein